MMKRKEWRCERRKGMYNFLIKEVRHERTTACWKNWKGKQKNSKKEKQNRVSKGRRVQWEEDRKGESLLHVAADVLTGKRKLKLSRVMTLILGEPLIIDQDHSGSELISFHTLQPCELTSKNRLRNGLQNITSLNTALTNHCIISLKPV